MNGNTKLMRFSIANDKELSRVLNILSKNAEVSDVLIVAEKEAEPKLVCSLDGKSIAKMVAKESPPSCDSLNIVTFPKVDN